MPEQVTNNLMQLDNREKIALDLVSLPPLIFRNVRSKITRNSVTDFNINITHLHFEVLILLEEEGPLHLAEICERLHIAKAHMTQLITRLVEYNLVERRFDKTDRRIINIFLTDYGRKVLGEHKMVVLSSMKEGMAKLSPQELDELQLSLQKLRDILSRI